MSAISFHKQRQQIPSKSNRTIRKHQKQSPLSSKALRNKLSNPQHTLTKMELTEIAKCLDLVRAQVKTFGITTVRLGKLIKCVLPDHDLIDPPSACIDRLQNGVIGYSMVSCNCHNTERQGLLLPDVRAMIAGRKEIVEEIEEHESIESYWAELNNPERVVWQLRLLNEAKLLKPASLGTTNWPAPGPNGFPALSKAIMQSFVYLLSLKWRYAPGDATTFSREFATCWIDLDIIGHRISAKTIGREINKLIRAGWLEVVGKHKSARLFLPGPTFHRYTKP